MKEELIKILPDLKEALAQGITYGGDLFNRAVNYYKITTLVLIGIYFVISVVLSIGLFKTFKKVKKESDDFDDGFLLSVWIASLVFDIVFIIFLMTEVYNYVKLQYIPEIFIIEKITSLIG